MKVRTFAALNRFVICEQSHLAHCVAAIDAMSTNPTVPSSSVSKIAFRPDRSIRWFGQNEAFDGRLKPSFFVRNAGGCSKWLVFVVVQPVPSRTIARRIAGRIRLAVSDPQVD
jgi:hypothetical protein